MHRQAITQNTLQQVMTRDDFRGIASAARPAYASRISSKAFDLYQTVFSAYPLKKWMLWNKPHFAPVSKEAELVLRRVSRNLRRALTWHQPIRSGIVENLKHLLGEGVPYRLYRLDIESFYESLDIGVARQLVEESELLSPGTKAILDSILHHQLTLGESGIPRGLAISATLSELLMRRFDTAISHMKGVFFYARYVDDIIIISSGRENFDEFLTRIKDQLPQGLGLNQKKFSSKLISRSERDATGVSKLNVEYLGYEFSVSDPLTGRPGAQRVVRCSISEKKIKKIKTRIFRALADYGRRADDELLIDRVKFLTSNFKVFNKNSGHTNMAGIFFNYSLIDQGDDKLKALDRFLRNAILSSKNNRRRGPTISLSNSLCRQLLRFSFERGHRDQTFTHFSGNRLEAIGRCWKY